MLSKLLDLIRAPKATAAELRAALAGIDTKAAEASVDQLEANRQKLLLQPNSDAELEAIEVEIRTANRDTERQYAAKRELERLLEQAEAREALAAVEHRATEGRAARERLIDHLAAVDRLAAELADRLGSIVADRATIRSANQAVLSADRADLKTNDPSGELALLLGHGNADAIPNPTTWHLGNYWPRTDTLGAVIGKARPLARIIELQPAPLQRKAA